MWRTRLSASPPCHTHQHDGAPALEAPVACTRSISQGCKGCEGCNFQCKRFTTYNVSALQWAHPTTCRPSTAPPTHPRGHLCQHLWPHARLHTCVNRPPPCRSPRRPSLRTSASQPSTTSSYARPPSPAPLASCPTAHVCQQPPSLPLTPQALAAHERLPALHCLIHCAATIASTFGLTPDGLEPHFAVNHLAPLLLTARLLPLLVAAGGPPPDDEGGSGGGALAAAAAAAAAAPLGDAGGGVPAPGFGLQQQQQQQEGGQQELGGGRARVTGKAGRLLQKL